MPNEMLEKVTSAIASQAPVFESFARHVQDNAARAVIEALQEPTPEMVAAGLKQINVLEKPYTSAPDCYCAMLSEILKEENSSHG